MMYDFYIFQITISAKVQEKPGQKRSREGITRVRAWKYGNYRAASFHGAREPHIAVQTR